MATFIIAAIVVVPIVLLLADLFVGKSRLTTSTPAAPAPDPDRGY